MRAPCNYNTKKIKCLWFNLFILFLTVFSAVTRAESVEIPSFGSGTLGKYSEYFQERDGQLNLIQAQKAFLHTDTNKGTSNSISLGINVDPVWMKITVNNSSDIEQHYRLSIETPWLDYIDTWLLNEGQVSRQITGGDAYAFDKRPMPYRFYAFEHAFPPGKTEMIIRIEAKGPMAIPVQFNSIESAIQRDINSAYQYGVLYGIKSRNSGACHSRRFVPI